MRYEGDRGPLAGEFGVGVWVPAPPGRAVEEAANRVPGLVGAVVEYRVG